MTRLYFSDVDTAILANHACTWLDTQLANFGPNTPIPDLKNQLLVELATHARWGARPVEWPSHCVDSAGETHGLWSIIRIKYARHNKGHAVAYTNDDTGRPSSDWMIINDVNLMVDTLTTTFNDNSNRFLHDMGSQATLNRALFHTDAIYVAMTDGQSDVMAIGRDILNASVTMSEEVTIETAGVLRRKYGWLSANDAILSFQRTCGVATGATMTIGNLLWDVYRGRPGLP